MDNKCGIVTAPLKFGLTMKEFTDAIIKPFGDAENGKRYHRNGDAFCSRCGQAITWEGKDDE